MEYNCDNCGWTGSESDLHTVFKVADEEVCPICGAFEECQPVELPFSIIEVN